MELLLIRHGLPERIEGAAGPADPALTEEGRRQAELLAGWLTHEAVDHVMSSTLRRARETAAPVGAAVGLDVEVVEGLSEFDADADSYIPIEELGTSWARPLTRPPSAISCSTRSRRSSAASRPSGWPSSAMAA